jgi:hypothetical protein
MNLSGGFYDSTFNWKDLVVQSNSRDGGIGEEIRSLETKPATAISGQLMIASA